MYFFHSGKHKIENTDCQPKVKDPQSQEEEYVTKSIDLDQNSDEENKSKEDGEESLYDWNTYLDALYEESENISDSNEENRNDLINKPYIQEIIKAEVEKQLKKLLKDKTSPRKYIPQPKWTWRERSAVA